MRARIGIGLIGAGKHGIRYATHVVRDCPGFALTALSRQTVGAGTAQARDWGARFHADWRELVADPAVDAVVAVVPPVLNPPIARAVAAARKPLLVEKPLAATAAEALEMVRVLGTAGVPCLMAHTLRWNVVARTLRDLLPTLGPLRALAVNQRFEPSRLDWLDRPEVSGGGIIIHTGVHSFDLVRFLTGREVVRATCRVARTFTRNTEDNFLAILDLDAPGTLVTASGSRATAGRSGLVDAACADGQLVADHQLHFGYRVRGLERTPLDLPPATFTVREVLGTFERMLRAGEAPPVTLEDGARAVAIAEACARSAATGAPADVAPIDRLLLTAAPPIG